MGGGREGGERVRKFELVGSSQLLCFECSHVRFTFFLHTVLMIKIHRIYAFDKYTTVTVLQATLTLVCVQYLHCSTRGGTLRFELCSTCTSCTSVRY